MALKDYYKVLGVRSTASFNEIKRSYRRLAIKYHPDKNPNDLLAEAAFREIAEAYDTLSDTKKRQNYNYRHFYIRDEKLQEMPVTSQSISNDLSELKKLVGKSNIFRLNQEALFFQLQQLLSDDNLLVLQNESVASTRRQIIESLLAICQPLNYNFIKEIEDKLIFFADDDTYLENRVNNFLVKQKRKDKWSRYKVILAVVAAILLCLVIFLEGS